MRVPIAVLDVGSTAIKGALVDEELQRFDVVEAPVALHQCEGRVEIDAEAVASAVSELLARLGEGGRAAAVGLACQRSTCLLWERAGGRAATPALSWMDRSTEPRTAALASQAGRIAERTGLRLSPHYAAPKLAALLDELPGGRRRAAAGELLAGTLDAFLVHRLTGAPSTEPGQAGRTLLCGLESGGWDEELCALFDIPAACLPPIAPSAGPRGQTASGPLTALAGDQQAALLGHGGWRTGVAACHFGTGAFVLASTGERILRHEGLLAAALATTEGERRHQLEGTVNAAGSALDWALTATGADLDTWRERALDPEALPRALPAFSGAGAPWWRPRAGAVLADLSLATSPEDLVGGVLCGIAMCVLDCVAAVREAGLALDLVRVSGRLTRLAGLVDLLADAGGLTVDVAADEEAGLAGIVRLARCGLTGTTAPLDFEPPAARRRQPRWSASRAARVRERWRSFAQLALRLADGD